MSKFLKCVTIGIAGIVLGLPSVGCQNSVEAGKADKASFYGGPPPASAQAQIKAQQDAQARAIAASGKRK
ncbi:MAG TPA: hypothetical protein VGK19_24730 [Capsulimonadaceae bacterium]